MHILLTFDDDVLRRYDARGSSLNFGIAWEHEGAYYPQEDWLDFGEAIIGMWLTTLVNLKQGADHGKFHFMDGPCAIEVTYDRDRNLLILRPDRTDLLWEIPFDTVVAELVRAITVVLQKMAALGIAEETRLSWERYLPRVKAELA